MTLVMITDLHPIPSQSSKVLDPCCIAMLEAFERCPTRSGDIDLTL